VEDLEKLWKNILSERDPNKPCISICSGTGCQASGCEDVSAAFQTELEKRELVDWIDLKRTGCHGFCEKGTIVVIQPDDICYLHVKPQDVPDIVSQTIIDRKVIDRLLYRNRTFLSTGTKRG
jgi:NADH-quinone oxidoreductase subunit F